eukprot:7704606-Pyramimonas_sp.AAC.1
MRTLPLRHSVEQPTGPRTYEGHAETKRGGAIANPYTAAFGGVLMASTDGLRVCRSGRGGDMGTLPVGPSAEFVAGPRNI